MTIKIKTLPVCFSKKLRQVFLMSLLFTGIANAGEFADGLTTRLNLFIETSLGVFPDGTPAKAEALALSSKVVEIVNLPIQGTEAVKDNAFDRAVLIAAEARQAYESFGNAMQNASVEIRTALDTVFVSTSGKITYEGTSTGVPGVVVVQSVPTNEGEVTIGLSITNLQGEYEIIYPGSVIALLDGNSELTTVVRPLFNLSPSTPGSWQVAYDADGVLTRVQVP